MADNQNPGQFGNRNDTEEQARKGGQQSPGQFGGEYPFHPLPAVATAPEVHYIGPDVGSCDAGPLISARFHIELQIPW